MLLFDLQLEWVLWIICRLSLFLTDPTRAECRWISIITAAGMQIQVYYQPQLRESRWRSISILTAAGILRDKVNREALSSSSIYTPSWAVKLHCFLALPPAQRMCMSALLLLCLLPYVSLVLCHFYFFWNCVVLKLVLTQEVTGLEVVLEIRGGWLGACFEIRGARVWIPSASTSHNGGMWKSSHPNPTTPLNYSHWHPNLDHIITACKELQKPNFCTQKLANIIHIWPQQLVNPSNNQENTQASVLSSELEIVTTHYYYRNSNLVLLFRNLDLVFTLPVPTAQD